MKSEVGWDSRSDHRTPYFRQQKPLICLRVRLWNDTNKKATMNRNPSKQNKTIQPGWGKGLSGCAIKIKVKVNSLLVIEIFELI